MNARIYFILGSTFFMGMFSGAYLYVTSFAPDYQKSEVEEVSQVDFRLRGEKIGGCQNTGVCPSFILNQNRTYEYIPAYRLQDGEADMVSGKMLKEDFVSLLDVLTETNLTQLQRTGGRCPSAAGGADYVYNLIYDGKEYILTTCSTVFGTSALAAQWISLWQTLATSTSPTGVMLEKGIDEFLKDQLDKRFEYDE